MKDLLEARFAGPNSPTNMQLGYFFLRLMLGMNLFFHGFMRLRLGMESLRAWEQPQAETFIDTYLPMPMVHFALHLIPVAELTIGALTILGLFTRWALLGGVMLFIVLLYGHTVRQGWSFVHLIMHYGFYYWALFVFIRYNWLALDNRFKKPA